MKTKYLSEVTNIKSGNSAPQGEEPFVNGKYNFYRTYDVGQIKQGEIFESRDKVNKETYSNLKIFPVNTILFPKSGASTFNNNRVIIKKEGAIASHLAGIKANSEFLNDYYLYYFLLTIDAKNLVQDSAYPSVNLKQISQIEIPVPSLQEQEKIVNKLEKLHESRIYFKKIKNSELVNYDKMYESLLNEVFQKLISTFPNVLLKEKTYIAGRIGWKGLSKKDYKEEGPLFINVSSLNYGQYVNFQESKHISEQRYFESENIGLVEGDVLICKDGSIGKIGIVGKLEELATVNSSLLIVRPLEGLLPKYLYYVFESPQFQSIVKSRIEGSTVPHLYQRDIKNFSIPLPPLEVQKESVKKLDRLYELIQDIKNNAELIQKGNDDLFKSVLRTEFSYE